MWGGRRSLSEKVKIAVLDNVLFLKRGKTLIGKGKELRLRQASCLRLRLDSPSLAAVFPLLDSPIMATPSSCRGVVGGRLGDYQRGWFACAKGIPSSSAPGGRRCSLAFPSGGRWHGGAVTDEVCGWVVGFDEP